MSCSCLLISHRKDTNMSKKLLIISIAVILCLAATAIVLYKVLAPQPELTEEQALAIALEHAGLTEEQVSYLNAHLDRDDGRWVYEIEFREGRTEYTLRASDGKVVDYDKDRDDENTSKKEAGNGFFFALL